MSVGFAEDMKWMREHARELRSKYPDMYVAVYEDGVVAADKDLKKVYEKAQPFGDRAIIKYFF
jgi:hypothetical protein